MGKKKLLDQAVHALPQQAKSGCQILAFGIFGCLFSASRLGEAQRSKADT